MVLLRLHSARCNHQHSRSSASLFSPRTAMLLLVLCLCGLCRSGAFDDVPSAGDRATAMDDDDQVPVCGICAAALFSKSGSHVFAANSAVLGWYGSAGTADSSGVFSVARCSSSPPSVDAAVVPVMEAFGVAGSGTIEITVEPSAVFANTSAATMDSRFVAPLAHAEDWPVAMPSGLPAALRSHHARLYARIAPTGAIPTALLRKAALTSPRWSAAEVRAWCSLPAVASMRIDPVVGGTLRYQPTAVGSFLVSAYLVQCSRVAFPIAYTATFLNSGDAVSIEELPLRSAFGAFFAVETAMTALWIGIIVYLSCCLGAAAAPNRHLRVQLYILYAMLLSLLASVLKMSVVEDAVGASDLGLRIIEVLLRTARNAFILFSRPLTAMGYPAFTTELSVGTRMALYFFTGTYITIGLASLSCEFGSSSICDFTVIGADVVDISVRTMSLVLLFRQCELAAAQLVSVDDPETTAYFLRFKSFRAPLVAMLMMPILTFTLRTAIVSWRNTYLVSLAREADVVFFFCFAIVFLRNRVRII